MDPRVLETQEWLNFNYSGVPGYEEIEEDGVTGFKTFYALIRAVQIELDIYPTADTFGPTTMQRFTSMYRQEPEAEPTNLNYILQGAFWCKGYNPGGFTGNFFSSTENAVKRFQSDVGIIESGIVNGKLMKAILNTDSFELSLSQGRGRVRTVQQTLNVSYSNYFDYIPTNGIFDRQTNRALIFALQHEIGLSAVANGTYGPATIAETPTLSTEFSPLELTKILQYALVCNGPEYDTFPFNGDYNNLVQTIVSDFQEFMRLPITGIADMPTIKQLLTSNGYTGRMAIAADASTVLDLETVQVLRDNGYGIIGRYLTGTVSGIRSKALTHQEIAAINHFGLRIFPIYQDGGAKKEYFTASQGEKDAIIAMNTAYELGFPSGTTIYFAVDYDALGDDVRDRIIPYMASVRRIFDNHRTEGPDFKVGVYGARNTCIQCMNHSSVLADHSFVANMSTGFSGNLGFPMPANWSFGQFFETPISSTVNGKNVSLNIDKNDFSGLDQGIAYIQPRPPKDAEYEALHETWLDLGRKIPVVKDSYLFSTEFEFNKSYTIYNTPFVKVDVTTASSYTIPGDVDSAKFTVSNNGINASLSEMLGDMYDEVSLNRLTDIEDLTNDISASIGNGYLSVTTSTESGNLVISVTAYKDNIKVEGDDDMTLAITVTYTFKNPFIIDIDFKPVMNAVIISGTAVALFALVFISLPALGTALGAAKAIAAVVALLVGSFAAA